MVGTWALREIGDEDEEEMGMWCRGAAAAGIPAVALYHITSEGVVPVSAQSVTVLQSGKRENSHCNDDLRPSERV